MRKILKPLGILGLISIFTLGLYSNGLNVNGVGAKANSMGGAFIGLADDASAVFWNPAGLVQLEGSNLTAGIELVIPTGNYKSDFFVPFGLPAIDATTKSKIYPLPFLGYFKAISPKMVVGFAVYTPSGIGAAWNGEELTTLTFPDPTAYKWESMVGCFTASPTIAIKINPKFSVGLTVNLNYGFLKVDQAAPGMGQYTESIAGMGFGATLGALFKPSPKFSIGLTLRTPSKINLSGDIKLPVMALLGAPAESDVERELTWPLWGGVGIAFKPIAPLTITVDAQYGDWGKMDKIGITVSDPIWQALGLAQAFELDLAWESTMHYRAGMQYMVNPGLAVRGGYYYDPAPGPDTRLNIVLPAPNSHWVTFGVGVIKSKFNIDLSAAYNLGGVDRVCGDTAEELAAVVAGEAMPGTHSLSIFTIGLDFTFKF
jgi:long-chain fatty acid transport protein